MVKKAKMGIFMILGFIFFAGIPVRALESIEIISSHICMPEITVFSKLEYPYSIEQITGMLDEDILEPMDIVPAENLSTIYYVLLDRSSSIKKTSLEAGKKFIQLLADARREQDTLVLVTFDESVDILLDGSESRTEIQETINSLSTQGSMTKFYDALARVWNHSEHVNTQKIQRKVAIILSDGIDVGNSNVTFSEVADQINENGITMYGIDLSKNQSHTDVKEQMGVLVRATGGAVYSLDTETPENTFDMLMKELSMCYAISYKAKSNLIWQGTRQLTVTITSDNSILSETIEVSARLWKPDPVPPEIEEIYYSKTTDTIHITFSEPVEGADELTNYDIVSEDGEHFSDISVRYSDSQREAIDIQFAASPVNGNYHFSLSNIYDISMEKNPLNLSQYQLQIKDGRFSESGRLALIFGGASAILVIAILLAYLLLGKNKNITEEKREEEMGMETEAIEDKKIDGPAGSAEIEKSEKISGYSIESVNVELEIYEKKRLLRITEISVGDGFCLGRSEICEMIFEDEKISRQHAMLECENGSLFITDLDSSNGTMVNGIKILTRYPLKPNDIITIGITNIKIKKINK